MSDNDLIPAGSGEAITLTAENVREFVADLSRLLVTRDNINFKFDHNLMYGNTIYKDPQPKLTIKMVDIL